MEREFSRPYTELLGRLETVRVKEVRLRVLKGSLLALTLATGLLVAAVALEETFGFGTAGRSVLFFLVAAGIGASIAWFVARPLLAKRAEPHAVAEKVGAFFPAVRDRLLDAMQIYEQREALAKSYSIPLIDASFRDLFDAVAGLDLTASVDDAGIRRFRKTMLVVGSAALLTFVISPEGFQGSLHRIYNFNQAFSATKPVEFDVEPGNIDAIRGRTIPVTIHTTGRPVSKVSLFARQHGQIDFEEIPLLPSSTGEFRTELKDVKLSTEYYASAEEEKSPTFTINVIDRPIVKSLRLSVIPPAYTRIPEKTLDENVGDVEAYPGSKVTGTIASSKDLSSAEMRFSDSTRSRLAVSGVTASLGFTVRKNQRYEIFLQDKNNLSSVDPIEYSVKALTDEYPVAEIVSPGKNVDLTDAMKIDLFVRLKDDFGFSKLRLAYRIAQSKYEMPKEEFSFLDIPLPAARQTVELLHPWDLSPLHLVPEDVVAYYIEVFDNDNVSGPKSGRSETYLIRLPSLEEVLSDVAQSHESSMESMQQTVKEAQALKKDVEELAREMKKNSQKVDWQQQQKAEQMLQRYESMKQTLESTAKKMDEMVKKMEENKLLSEQTMEKYSELQKLMDELKSPELQEALKKLQQSMKQLSPEQMKQAMEQLKSSEDQLRKNLERIVDLLKRIHIEQKLDELIKRVEELQKQQEGLKEQASKTDPANEGERSEEAKKQSDLANQMEALEKEAKELQEKMEEFPKEMPLEEMGKTRDAMKQKNTRGKMSKAAQQMKSGEMAAAQENQEEAEKDLDEIEKQLEAVRKELRDKQQKQIVEEMRRQLQNIIELSKEEEGLKNEAKGLDPNSQRFRENGERQNSVKGDLANVANAMGELGKKTFAVSPEMGREIGNAMNQMEMAIQQTEGRNPAGTSQRQGEAMSSLNRAAMMMQGALSGMQGQGGMGMAGLLGRLSQMAGQQGGINQGTQGAMGMGNEGRPMTAEQQAAYERLGNQQAALQKSLEELSREAKNAGEFSKLLGDLDQVARQMQEVQTDLVQGNVNPETIQKQDRILSRLLDASRSTRERDYEKRRRAESGKNLKQLSPADLDFTTQEGKNRFREELLKLKEGKYSKDFEELIRKYFEQLEKEKIEQ